MDNNFIILPKEKRPIAIVIMAYFIVLFHVLGYVVYHHQESHLISTIAEILDSQHTKWPSWPAKETEIISRSRFRVGKLAV